MFTESLRIRNICMFIIFIEYMSLRIILVGIWEYKKVKRADVGPLYFFIIWYKLSGYCINPCRTPDGSLQLRLYLSISTQAAYFRLVNG